MSNLNIIEKQRTIISELVKVKSSFAVSSYLLWNITGEFDEQMLKPQRFNADRKEEEETTVVVHTSVLLLIQSQELKFIKQQK